MEVVSFFILIDVIILRAVYEEYHIGILLDGSRLTEVTQLWAFSFKSLTVFYVTAQLRQSQDRNIQLFGKSLERTGNGRDLLLSAAEFHTVGIHQLQIVNHDNLDTFFAHQSTSLGSQFKHREARCIVHIDRSIGQSADSLVQSFPVRRVQLTIQDLTSRDLAYITDKTVDQLDVVHFKREEADRNPIIYSHILGNT